MKTAVNPTHHEEARIDAFSFYAMATISFIESNVGVYVENLRPFYKDNPDVSRWLSKVWAVEEGRHGAWSKAFVQKTWPEFDWDAAYANFVQRYNPTCETSRLRKSPGLEALARCVTETETAMIYRAISAYTKSPPLKRLLEKMGGDEVRHYKYFRDIHLQYDAQERLPGWRKVKIILERSELVKDEDMWLAFESLDQFWRSRAPFRALSYDEYCSRAYTIAREHFPFQTAKHMLFHRRIVGRLLSWTAGDIVYAAVVRYLMGKLKGPLTPNAEKTPILKWNWQTLAQ